MKNSIMGCKQEDALKYDIDLSDIALLNYIKDACVSPKMLKTTDNSNQPYVWLKHQKVIEDMPILGLKEDGLKRRLKVLTEKGLITSIVKNDEIRGRRTYYTVTIKYIDMLYTDSSDDQSDFNTLGQDINTHQSYSDNLGNARPSVPESPSDNKLNIDNKLNDNFTNVKLEQPAVTPQPKRRVRLVDTPNNSVNENIVKNTANQEKPKRKSLYQSCIEEIYSFSGENTKLRDKLVEFLNVRLELKNKPFGSKTFKSYLNKLGELSSGSEEQIKIIQQSIDRQYSTFYEVKKYTSNYNKNRGFQDPTVFSEYGQVKSEKRANEVIMNVSF